MLAIRARTGNRRRRRPGRTGVFLLAMAGLWCCLLSAREARAEENAPPKTPAALAQRTATIALDKTKVIASLNYRDVVDAEISKKLLSGLPTVIALRAYLFLEGKNEPIALAAKTCRIVYDLWDEVFRLQIVQPGSSTTTIAVNTEGVLRNCAEARKLTLIDRALLKDNTKYFIAALVEVNPISAEMLDRIKRWVSRPNGSAAIGPGDSLFGSFVGLFVTRVESADRRLAFRTQSFVPPVPPPPPPSPPPP